VTTRHSILQWLAALSVLLVGAAMAHARNVDLTTVPPRESVQLTIYNSEDLTLVRETRNLSLKKYPGDKPQHCIWNIQSDIEGQVKFQVTYFTSGISWSADYVLITNPEETEMSFDGYVQIYNNSGEEYDGAQVRLVVGVVNLVEKIQDLARRGLVPMPMAGKRLEKKSRELAVYAAVADFDAMKEDRGAAPEIIKEGLSEYFIYTIEGTQTIPNRWSKRLVSFRARQVTFEILYRMRPHQYGPEPIRFFLVRNDTEHKLGTTPLPDGIVRTFRDNGRDGLEFLGAQQNKYVPIKEDIELKLGVDDEIVHERDLMSVERRNFTFEAPGPHVVGWDEVQSFKEQVRNYKGKAIRMEIRHQIPGDVELDAEGAKLHDFHTMELTLDVPARTTLPWHYVCTQHYGRNAKQNRIRLK